MPMSFSMAFVTIGVLLLILSQRQTLAKILCGLGIFSLLLFSWNPFSTALLRPIEQYHGAFDINQEVDFVLVLGNGVTSDESVPKYSHLSSSATARILEGLRIAKAQPNSTLIVSGYAGKNSISCAQAYAEMAIDMGINPERIIKLEDPRDTHEEALAAKNIIGNARLALVTSASHMPRAYNYFASQNINAFTAPTFYLAKYSEQSDLKFNAAGLLKSERAIYEYIGLLWQWLKHE